jgi:hypothetical protein
MITKAHVFLVLARQENMLQRMFFFNPAELSSPHEQGAC